MRPTLAPTKRQWGPTLDALARSLIIAPRTWVLRWSWRNLWLASSVQERLRRRFTAAGQAVLAASLTAALFGLDTRQTASYQAFALGAGLLLTAWMGSRRAPRGLIAHRRLPRHATVGEPCRYVIELTNDGPRAVAGLEAEECLPDPRPNRAAFLATPSPGTKRVSPLARLFGYPRWEALVHQRRLAEPMTPLALPRIGAGGHHRQTLEITPRRRGVLRLDALAVARTDPLGLMRKAALIGGVDRLLVLPRRYPVRPRPRPGRRRFQPGGITLAATVGESREFVGLRDYLPGDSPRHIHWAAWARCGEPVVKEYQDEYFSRHALILDCFPPTNALAEAAFECAVSVAASFIEPLVEAGGGTDSLLDLLLVADRAHTITAGRGLMSSQAMLELLAGLEPIPMRGPPDNAPGGRRPPGFATLADSVLARAPLLSACLLVLLDWDSERRGLVARLRALGLPMQVLVVGRFAAPLDPGPMGGLANELVVVDPLDPAPTLASL